MITGLLIKTTRNQYKELSVNVIIIIDYYYTHKSIAGI